MQIIALGGGGFSDEPDNLALERYIIEQTGKVAPKVCFLAQASGEASLYIINFYRAFNSLDCKASHLSLFQPHTTDIEGFLCSQDVIYVGGGNTKSMLALWRAWNLDDYLSKAGEDGTILAGISAGANCWFEHFTTDSTGELQPMQGLGFIAGSCSPHYDGEVKRRPTFQRLIAEGDIPAGIALDDGAAAHYVDGELKAVVASRPNAKGYRVEKGDEGAIETMLETRYLLADE